MDRGSLAQVATMVEEIRSEAGHPVVLFDSGDTLQGSPFEQFVHVRWGEPSPTIDAMNRIGYQAMAVGNHEFNFGLEVLRRAEKQAGFPFLSANTLLEGTEDPAFPPYLVLAEGALKIGVLGLTTPNVPGWEQPEHYRGLRFEPMDTSARRWVPVLREEEDCDVVVVLAHTGFEKDPKTGESNNTEYENYGWRLTQVDGIDLLLTGHAHDRIDPMEVNETIVSQPQARARYVTRFDLWFEPEGDGWRVARWEGANLSLEKEADDRKIVAVFEPAHRRLAEALDAPITRVTEPVSVHGCRLVDCAALDLIHEVQLDASGADLSLASLLTDGTPDLPVGPVTWRWVYGLYVYPNTLQAVEVTGAQLGEILEHAALFYEGFDCSPVDGCVVVTNPDVRTYNVDSIAGLSYRIDPTRSAGERVRDVRFNGKDLEPDAVFKLAMNNYRGAGGGGFPHLADAKVVWTSSAEMPVLIGEYLESRDPWQPSVDGNWWIGRDIVSEQQLAE
jgi:2',3'-cyclic-nucleotide 2'-phosphodiesterase/3'-nucleotidase